MRVRTSVRYASDPDLDHSRTGAAAFCVDGGWAEKMVPRPGRPERTAALQHAKAQSGTFAFPAASQITAAAKIRAVGLRQRQTRRSLRSRRRSVPVLVAPRSPTTRTGEHLEPMNRLSDSIIYCVHSKPNGYDSGQTRRSGHLQEGDRGTPLTVSAARPGIEWRPTRSMLPPPPRAASRQAASGPHSFLRALLQKLQAARIRSCQRGRTSGLKALTSSQSS